MPKSQSWIVCETAGRWSAALRIALARRQATSVSHVASPGIQTVRSLEELEAGMKSDGHALGFVEVRNENLAAVLELLAKCVRRNLRLVALLESELGRRPELELSQPGGRQSAADALAEAGALTVVDSPRRISTAIQVAERYCAVRTGPEASTVGLDSIADRAWASLPWQDA